MRVSLEQSSPKGEGYRADIDGLRGIAVLSVILFHIDGRILPGGFVGVDIFFVISGYLISLHIFSDIERGRFSLAEFYRRRIKRIAPAMLTVVAVTLAITQTLFVPDDAEVAAEAAFFSLLSLANVYFWRFFDTSYFAPLSDEQPFLHLWSLGVEEQFYIAWPLLLLVFYRKASTIRFIFFCAGAAAFSFLLGDALFPRDSSFVYYMLPTRAGELLLGALAAQWIMRRGADAPNQHLVAAVSIAGMALVLGSCSWASETEAFPGWRAIPPTLGTSMLIVAGHYRTTVATRMLRCRPLAWMGVISYSAYLWHWPLLSIPKYFGVEFDPLRGVAVFVATVVTAWLSYRFVELPARRTRDSFMRVAWRQYLVPAGSLAAICVAAKLADGYGPRLFFQELKDRIAAAELETEPAFESRYICQRDQITVSDLKNPDCIVGAVPNAEPGVILWGDSNASQYVGMLGAFARKEGYSFRNVVAQGCPPLIHDIEAIVNASNLPRCRVSSAVVVPFLPNHAVVWIAADWLTYSRRSPQFFKALEATVRDIAGRGQRVVVLGKAPVIEGYDRRCKQTAIMVPSIRCGFPSAPLSRDVLRVNAEVEAIAKRIPGATYFDANAYLCAHGDCSVRDESGRLIYYDKNHLSLDASWRLGERIIRDVVPEAFRGNGQTAGGGVADQLGRAH